MAFALVTFKSNAGRGRTFFNNLLSNRWQNGEGSFYGKQSEEKISGVYFVCFYVGMRVDYGFWIMSALRNEQNEY